MSSSTPEITYCFSSQNRIAPGPPGNETNDITVAVNLTSSRVAVRALEVATAEFDPAQRLIEKEWSRVYISGGIPMTNDNPQSRELLIEPQGIKIVFPINVNPLLSVGADGTFTTVVPHLLGSMLKYWNWGQPVILGGLPSMVTITTSNIQLISEVSFRVNGVVSMASWSVAGAFLYFPPLPSYRILASILNGRVGNGYQIEWNDQEGCLSIRSYKSSVTHLIVESGSLMDQIGFGLGQQALLPQVALKSQPGFCLGVTSFRLTADNYDLSSLVTELQLQLNRFYFPSAVSFQIGDLSGQLFTVTLAAGMYTPTAIVRSINLQLRVLPTVAAQVSYSELPDVNTNEFTFSSILKFILYFESTQSSAALVTALGFHPARYTSRTTYSSNIEFEFPVTPPTLYCITSNSSQQLLVTPAPSPIVPATSVQQVQVSSSSSSLITVNTTYAHGLAELDLALVTVNGGTQRVVRITGVLSGTQVQFVMAGAGTVTTLAIGPYNPTTVSFLMAPRSLSTHASIFGFRPVDVWWTPDFPETFAPAFPADLVGWAYALLEMVEPSGQARIEHMGPKPYQEVKSQLIGKFINLRNNLNLERFYQMTTTFFDKITLTQIRLRLLNPDYTLYQFHGREWSLTIRLYL